MDKHLIHRQQVPVSELLDLIGQDYLSSLAQELESDKWVIKLKTKTIFNLLIYSLLESNRVGLRGMEANYSSAIFQAIEHLAVGDTTAHSSIRDRLTQIDSSYFERVYNRVYQMVSSHYDQSALSKYNIKRYDSTMIHIFGHLMSGMKVGNSSNNKYQVKLTTELENDFCIRMKFFSDQNHLSEETSLKEVIQESQHGKKDLIVFDRGLKSRDTFKEFSDKETQFVTRLNANTRYQTLRQHQPLPTIEHDEISILKDEIVYLYGTGNNLVKQEFRLIEVVTKDDKSNLLFLTNVVDISAYLVAYIYRQRWQIEVFFRFMKQEMNLTHFVSYNENAIKVVLYATLIAAMLVLVYKKLNSINSYKKAKIQFFKELQANVILEVIELPDGLDKLKKYLAFQARRN
ncbi:IS4 family transposase [Cellulophaga sp. BC115SP]|uniref:IS4 family transposase n=1 Tax=Cellulophaga sp. BC115SP TaxID=2683263 RepID=UPI001412F5EE|nr:IS4 family transposase [Cellulophaga sp. BC115SP]NBB27303.1 IS4 family transposase [Cellulophaga sp. BC115SP]